jgi:hypothetical protein
MITFHFIENYILLFHTKIIKSLLLLWRCDPTRVMASSFLRFSRSHTKRRTTVGRTHLDEWSARRNRSLPDNIQHSQQIKSIPPLGFEPKISAGERPQTYALDRAASGTGKLITIYRYITSAWKQCVTEVFIRTKNEKGGQYRVA